MNPDDDVNNTNSCQNGDLNSQGDRNNNITEIETGEDEQEGTQSSAPSRAESAHVAVIPTEGDNLSESPRKDFAEPQPTILPTASVAIPPDSDAKAGRKLVGKKVLTTFGVGVVKDFRSKDDIYEILLESKTNLFTPNIPKICPKTPAEIAKELNETYEALEKMRRLNLDIQCHEMGIPCERVDHNMCTACLLANKGETQSHFPKLQRFVESVHETTADMDHQVQESMPRLHKFFNPTSTPSWTATTESTTSITGSSTQKPGAAATTKKNFPRIRRLIDSANVAAHDLDHQVTNFFGTTTDSSTTDSSTTDDAQLSEQFPRIHKLFNPTASVPSSKAMADMISSSLRHSSTATGKPAATNPNAATAVAAPNAAGSSSSSSPVSKERATKKTADATIANGTETNPMVSATTDSKPSATVPATKTRKSPTHASAGSKTTASATPSPSRNSGSAPQSSQSFPRLRRLWGSVQTLPQPSPQMKSPPPSATKTSRAADGEDSKRNADSRAPPTSADTKSTSAPTMMGIQDILNSSVTTTIFGENKVKEDGSSADPNVIMQNRIVDPEYSSPAPVKSDKPIALPRIQRLLNKREQANTNPCLICASPTCPSCASPNFRKEGITVCLDCERLFELDFIVDCVSSANPAEREKHIEYMLDCYDRCMLLLTYSTQFAEQIAASLEDQTKKQDIIGLASSSVGVLSGVLGIAAAASILTPAGPPLLIASLFFGGGATTVQSGTEALNYLSEPRKLADRIIALHGMSLSILRVTSTLRDSLMRDHIRTDVYEVQGTGVGEQMADSYKKGKTGIVMGSNFGRSVTLGGIAGARVGAASARTAAAVEVSVVTAAGSTAATTTAAAAGSTAATAAAAGTTAATTAGSTAATAAATGSATAARGATAVSRAGTAAARTIRFARFAGGALSAAVLVMEANAIHSTVRSIRDGSPSDKADTLRSVMSELEDFPSTEELDAECHAYLEVLASRPAAVEASCAAEPDEDRDNEIPVAACLPLSGGGDDNGRLSAPGAVIVEAAANEDHGDEDAGRPVPPAAAADARSRSSFLRGSSSLFQRLQNRREDRQVAEEEVVAVLLDDDGGQLGDTLTSLVL